MLDDIRCVWSFMVLLVQNLCCPIWLNGGGSKGVRLTMLCDRKARLEWSDLKVGSNEFCGQKVKGKALRQGVEFRERRVWPAWYHISVFEKLCLAHDLAFGRHHSYLYLVLVCDCNTVTLMQMTSEKCLKQTHKTASDRIYKTNKSSILFLWLF